MIEKWYKSRISPDLLSTEDLLAKKLDENSLSKLVSRSHDEASSIHIKPSNTNDKHPEFNDAIESKKEYKPEHFDQGYENKLVYNTPNGKFMVKPYNSKEFNGTSGISSIITKKLYDAAGMQNNIENVKTHNLVTSLGQIPVNVHKFENNVSHADKSIHKINPVEAHQVHLMDFLTGNDDRHSENFLVRNDPDKNGYNPLVAIDHGAALNYNNLSNKISDIQSSQLDLLDADGKSDRHMNNVASWWLHHSPQIKSAFIDEINGITNEPFRDNIISHFKNRHQAITDWANQQLDPSVVDKQPIKKIKSAPTESQKKSYQYGLEKVKSRDPAQNLLKIAEMMHAKKYDFNHIRDNINNSVLLGKYGQIPREKFADIMAAFPHNDEGHQARIHLVTGLIDDFLGKKTDFDKHMDRIKLRDILVHDDKQPEGAKHLNPYMAAKVKRFLGDIDS